MVQKIAKNVYEVLLNCVANLERMLSDICKDRRVTSANIKQVFKKPKNNQKYQQEVNGQQPVKVKIHL